jgi:hypothetical protein
LIFVSRSEFIAGKVNHERTRMNTNSIQRQ